MKILEKIDEKLSIFDLAEQIRNHENMISEGAKVGGREYDDFFKEMLKKYKIKSYKDLPKDKQAKFFDDVDKSWDSKVEKGQTSKKYRKGQSSMADD